VYRELVTVADIDAVLARHPRQPGTRRLREVVERLTRTGPQITRSEFEERFLPLVEAAGLPSPRVNHRVRGHTVDFFWPEARLVVETDGLHAHLRPTAFEDDRARDAELHAAGYVVLRFT
jgi:very-short-patch-repair endonuclease